MLYLEFMPLSIPLIGATLEQMSTRFGPNRPAADMEGNGDFLEIFEDFWKISWRFLGIF